MFTFAFSHQWIPLRVAAGSGSIDMVRYLGDKGANFNIKDDHGVSK